MHGLQVTNLPRVMHRFVSEPGRNVECGEPKLCCNHNMGDSFLILHFGLQYLAEAGWTAEGRVVGVTQPRRVAAVSVSFSPVFSLYCHYNL